MATAVQVTFDSAEPRELAGFWAQALGYVDNPPPPGFDSWDAFLDSIHVPTEARGNFWALVDPDGKGPRLFFQKVPEGKTAKNRVHLDVNVGAGIDDADTKRAAVRAKADELIGVGATEVKDTDERGEHWIVLQDPEGNEFCLQ